MNNTQQINEDYKFRIAYIGAWLKDLFATSNEIEQTNLDKKIKEIAAQEDVKHIEGLEKDINTFITKKATKIKSATVNNKNVKEELQQKETNRQANKTNVANNKSSERILEESEEKTL